MLFKLYIIFINNLRKIRLTKNFSFGFYSKIVYKFDYNDLLFNFPKKKTLIKSIKFFFNNLLIENIIYFKNNMLIKNINYFINNKLIQYIYYFYFIYKLVGEVNCNFKKMVADKVLYMVKLNYIY